MDCPICLGPLNRCPDGIEDNIRRRLTNIRSATCCCTPCGHIFHKACLLRWLDRTNRPPCPVCNVKLSKMKLYPAYLNVDKISTAGPTRARNDDDSLGGSVGDGAGAPPSLTRANSNGSVESNTSFSAIDLAHASKQNRSGGSINGNATTSGNAGSGPSFCSMSHNAPAACGVTTMTMGTYALTSLGPVPLVTATTIGIGPSAGAMITPAHSNSQSARVEMGNSAFMSFPRDSNSTGAGIKTFTSWGTGSEATITNTISTDQEYPFGGATSITTTILGNEFRPSVIKRGLPVIDYSARSNYNRDGSLRFRYQPYQQPPPAHSMSSSSFSRRNDQVYSMFYNNVFGTGTGEGSGTEEGMPASRAYGRGHASDEYDHDDGSPTQTE